MVVMFDEQNGMRRFWDY